MSEGATDGGGAMLSIDTNVLVRMIAQDDVAQMRLAEAAIGNGAWISHLVLAEAVWVLGDRYGLKRAQLIRTLDGLLTHPHLAIQDRDVVVAALDHFKQNSKIEFADCLILEVARKGGHLPLATFDRNLGKLEGVRPIVAKA
jgi:predicted nucleic-acid-binding protein